MGADLSLTNLGMANLSGANLRGANLIGANLGSAKLFKASLNSANLIGARLSGANLIGADLSGAVLYETNMTGATMRLVNLTGAIMRGADLSGTDLRGADMTGADLSVANLSGVTFELKEGALPDITSFSTVKYLFLLTFNESPHSLYSLKEGLKNAGLRRQEREVTYAIEHTYRLHLWKEGFKGKIESIFKYVLFEVTCNYGMTPSRPLMILIFLIPFFSIPYIFAIRRGGEDGIWKEWAKERIRKDIGSEKPEQINLMPPRDLYLGMYFSILSAFHVGWKDLNVGNWIARIQPREYTLKATGWVRTVSGIQSLISVYLLALWVLTYFGRPFG